MVWQEKEAHQYDKVKGMADDAKEDIPDFIKKLLSELINPDSS